jgi:periplasmic protein TonB
MASSDIVHHIAYPAFPGPGLRIGSRVATFPAEGKERRPVSPSLQEGCLFHDSLIVSGENSRPRNPWAAAGSLTFQLLVLTALIVIPLYQTVPLPKREVLTMLYAPPAAAAASNATRLQAPIPAYTSKSIPAPTPNTQVAPPPPLGTTGGVAGGVPGGVGEVPSGVLNEALSSTRSLPVLAKTPAPAPAKRIRVAARVAEANLVHDVAPAYPPEAGRARIEGTVVLMAVIGKDGSVQDVRVESGLPLLAQAAIDAVKQWRYKPYTIDGEPVEVDSRITINFTLSRG